MKQEQIKNELAKHVKEAIKELYNQTLLNMNVYMQNNRKMVISISKLNSSAVKLLEAVVERINKQEWEKVFELCTENILAFVYGYEQTVKDNETDHDTTIINTLLEIGYEAKVNLEAMV